MNHTKEVIESVLRKIVPEAEDNQIYHQLEYLTAYLYNGKYILTGSNFREKPTFLGVFYGKDKNLTLEIQIALNIYYKEIMENLFKRVFDAIQSLAIINISATSLWLTEKQQYPIENNLFMGLNTRYHKYSEEFVAAFEYGKIILI